MRTDNIPENLNITLEDFISLECQLILNNMDNKSYTSYYQYLKNISDEKIKNNHFKLGKIFLLLSNICSMILDSKSKNEPFKPLIQLFQENKRSLIPDDLTKDEIDFLEQILDYCKDYKIKSRIADLLGLIKKPKNINYIEIAIENYQLFPLSYNSLLSDSKDAWERAITLSLSYRKPLKKIQEKLFEEFKSSKIQDNYYLYKLEQLLLIVKIDEKYHFEIMNKLELSANFILENNSFKRARDYYRITKNWTKEKDKLLELTILIAESYINEANKSNELLAGDLFENAIKEFRKIPKVNRSEYNVDEKIDDVHKKMNKANKLSLKYMQSIRGSKVDLSKLIKNSKNSVRNKSLLEALQSFVNIYSIKILSEREKEVRGVKKGFFSKMFFSNSKHISNDGRIIARNKDNSEHDMYQSYFIELQLIVKGIIVPSFQQILLEHRITIDELYLLLNESTILPTNREIIWVEGIFFGFENNFLVSTHLLIPQLENLIRLIMKKNGIKTSTIDKDGIETENGLSTLLKIKNINKFIDENLIFELKALLTEQLGLNLRNGVAHGLCNINEFNSIYSVYLWWFSLKLLINNLPKKT